MLKMFTSREPEKIKAALSDKKKTEGHIER